MADFPTVKARELIAALKRAGFVVHNQVGSHVQLKHPLRPGKVTVPNHQGADIRIGLLRSILQQAGMTTEEFRRLFKK